MKKLRRISLAKISLREVENQLCEVEMDSWE